MSTNSEKAALKKFGSNVAYFRSRKNMTQEQLAEAANLDRMTIAFIEGGRRWPRLSTLQAIASELNIEIQKLFREI
jgi:transcriptional regulator with XRE-family HTH domain